MAVVVTGATLASLPALTALAPFGTLAVTVDPDAANAPSLAESLRALGHEVLLMPHDVGAADVASVIDDAVARVPVAAGFAFGPTLPGAAREALLAATARHGGLVVDTVPAAESALVTAARAAALPTGGAALAVVAATDATRAFQLLREAGARTAREGQMIVVVEAVPVTLTALGRWLALPGEATPAPLTAVIARLGPTAY